MKRSATWTETCGVQTPWVTSRLFFNSYELVKLERIKECSDTQGIIIMFAVSNFLLTINSSVNLLVYKIQE